MFCPQQSLGALRTVCLVLGRAPSSGDKELVRDRQVSELLQKASLTAAPSPSRMNRCGGTSREAQTEGESLVPPPVPPPTTVDLRMLGLGCRSKRCPHTLVPGEDVGLGSVQHSGFS